MEFSTWGDWEPAVLMISGFAGSVGESVDCEAAELQMMAPAGT